MEGRFEGKGLKDNLVKKLCSVEALHKMDYPQLSYPCGMCGQRVKTNSVLRVQCGKWIQRERLKKGT